MTLNRHPHHLLVGLHDTVSDRDESAERGFGLGDRGDHIDHIGLAGSEGLSLDIRLVAGGPTSSTALLSRAAKSGPAPPASPDGGQGPRSPR